MYKYRITEMPEREFSSEDDAKKFAKEFVAETHKTCFVERFNGEKWQRGSVRYFWYFGRVCFWNGY